MNSTLKLPATSLARRVAPRRVSELLRGILTGNPERKNFSVEHILTAIGSDHVEASLVMFSIPAIVPVPTQRGMITLPLSALARQLLSGERQLRLPRLVLKKSITRRALAVAIHATLPVIEAAEKAARPRWTWVSSKSVKRAVGILVLLLAIANAYPLLGFNPLHAVSIFVMALGMAEQDGLAVLVGVFVGLLSLVSLATSGFSPRALRVRAGRWLRKIGRRLGLDLLAAYLERRGHALLARLLTFQWSDLLLLWDPEKSQALPPAVATQRRRAPQALKSSATLSNHGFASRRTPRYVGSVAVGV